MRHFVRALSLLPSQGMWPSQTLLGKRLSRFVRLFFLRAAAAYKGGAYLLRFITKSLPHTHLFKKVTLNIQRITK
jgi:hypothetical protein